MDRTDEAIAAREDTRRRLEGNSATRPRAPESLLDRLGTVHARLDHIEGMLRLLLRAQLVGGAPLDSDLRDEIERALGHGWVVE